MCSYQSHRPESKKKVISLQEANSTESSGDGRRSQTDGCVCRKANQTITQLWSAHLMERREENGYVVALRANLLGCVNRSNSANTTYSFSKDEQVFIHCYYRKIFLKRSEDIQWSVFKMHVLCIQRENKCFLTCKGFTAGQTAISQSQRSDLKEDWWFSWSRHW